MFSPSGAIAGGDLSGTIAKIGPNVQNKALKIGDKVAGTIHGNVGPKRGAFAEYAAAMSDHCLFKVPEGTDLAEASTFGVAWVTALQAILESQGHGWPGEGKKVEGEPWVSEECLTSSFGSGLWALRGKGSLAWFVRRSRDAIERNLATDGGCGGHDLTPVPSIRRLHRRRPLRTPTSPSDRVQAPSHSRKAQPRPRQILRRGRRSRLQGRRRRRADQEDHWWGSDDRAGYHLRGQII